MKGRRGEKECGERGQGMEAGAGQGQGKMAGEDVHDNAAAAVQGHDQRR